MWFASYRHLASRRDIYFLPTSFKSPAIFLKSNASARHFESYATDVFITPRLSACFVEGCQQGKNSEALINVATNFGYEYFCFVIYVSKIFFVKTFPKIFLPEFVSQNYFFKIFLSKLFLRALLSMPPRLQRQNGLCYKKI